MQNLERAAQRIAAARLAGEPLGLLPEGERPPDEAAAYRVQDRLHAILTEAGRGPVMGHKIGCTTPVMQRYLGIPNPCAGGVFARAVHRSPALLAHDEFIRVGVECEIAVRIARDLDHMDAPFTADRMAHAIDACMAAVEIVDDRYADWRRTDAPTLIADDFFAAGCVLGEPVARGRWPALADAVGTTRVNGREVGQGRGADVMGHPFRALAWLANMLAARGRGLRRGEFVLTGSLVETRWLAPGDRVSVEVAGLGSVSAEFA
jgi:2-oxo-3-hexenedioate decarboxylase/2-keto-4-pentenoate hydratase